MANWKVSKQVIEVLPHGNAENLEIIRAGEYQLVSRKGMYVSGQQVIVVPDKSLLTNGSMLKEYGKYLVGSSKNRVKSVSLRGEISQGITWPLDEVEEAFGTRIADLVEAAPLDEDISELLGVKKYEPPIPRELSGQVRGIVLGGAKTPLGHDIYRHDCYQWGAFAKEFDPEEVVVVTEKIHGSMCSYTVVFEDGEVVQEVVSSKGQLSRGLSLVESESNFYWKAIRETNLVDDVQIAAEYLRLRDGVITLTGELVPVQKGFSYGFSANQPEILIFDVEVNGEHLSIERIPLEIMARWVPIISVGTPSELDVYALAQGMEQVSGKELHIREGVCITPFTPRRSFKGGFNLNLKVINPAYSKKETGEEIN